MAVTLMHSLDLGVDGEHPISSLENEVYLKKKKNHDNYR